MDESHVHIRHIWFNVSPHWTSRASRLTCEIRTAATAPQMYMLRTDTASLVLNCQYNSVDVLPLARLISLFLTPKPTWKRAISKLHTNESSLRDVQYLDAHHVRETDFKDITEEHPQGMNYHTAMDEAAKLGFLSVVQFLHTSSLKGCKKYAMDHAAKNGHLHVVQWLHENRTEGCSYNAMMDAACDGHIEVVRFLREVVNPGDVVKYNVWNNAASHGRVQVVQYLTNQVRASLRQETQSMHPQWTSEAVEEAVQMELVKWVDTVRPGRSKYDMIRDVARQGFTEMVVYLFLNGFVGDFLHVQNANGFTANAMDQAAKHGHLDIVQYLHQNRTEGCTVKAMDQAAKHGHLDIVQILDTHRDEGCTVEAMDQASAGGYLAVVQHLHVHRTEGCTSQAMTQAVLEGHLDVVQFLHENRSEGCDDVSEHFKYYAANDVAMLAYLHANQLVELDPEAFCSECSLEMLVFLYDHCVAHMTIDNRLRLVHGVLGQALVELDLPRIQYLDSKRPLGDIFLSKAMDQAAASGKLDVLTYLHTHGGHGGCTTEAMDNAAKNGHLDIVQFLHHHRTEGCTTEAMDEAAGKKDLDSMQFSHHYRSEGCMTTAMDTARRHGHLDIVQFLHLNRSEGCTARALENAASLGSLQIAQFLCANRPNESCVVQGLKAARRDKQRHMIEFLESQLPCACLRCPNPRKRCRR